MSPDRDATALQTNAADPRQVSYGRRAERDRQEATDGAFRETLGTVAGRRVFWDLLSRLGVFHSVMHADPNRVFYNAGRQDFGHELLDQIITLDPRLYLDMEREARAEQARQTRSNVAVRTPSTEESEQLT